MRRSRLLAVALLFAVACTTRAHRTAPAPDHSGFLDDYRLLGPGPEGGFALVYRNPKVDWAKYDEVLVEPVTLWRSGRKALEPVPEADPLRLIADLETAVQRRLDTTFRPTDEPGPRTLRIRLAIT